MHPGYAPQSQGYAPQQQQKTVQEAKFCELEASDGEKSR
jgi:hypothetical protein